MPKVTDVCRYVRSKNAGPYWITVDFFFADDAMFEAYSDSDAFSEAELAKVLGTDTDQIKKDRLPELAVIKLSYPRPAPQGGIVERDMHGGQQYVRLLDVEV